MGKKAGKKKKAKKKASKKAPSSAGVERMSPKDYGAHRGVSRQAVMRAIADDRLTSESWARTDAGYYRIDPAKADEEWERWTDPSAQVGASEKAGGRPARTGTLFDEADAEVRGTKLSHAKASAERIIVDTRLKELELAEREGRLIDRHVADREFYRIGREFRDALFRIDTNVSAEFASDADPASIERRLHEEHVRVIESVLKIPEDLE